MSLCATCKGLEVWPGVFCVRYLCGIRWGDMPKAFGQYGKPVKSGIPLVKQCAKYQHGKHYSRKNINEQATA